MKKVPLFLRIAASLLTAALLLGTLAGCAGRGVETGETSDAPLSPAIGMLKRDAAEALRFCTPYYRDFTFSADKMKELFGASLDYITVGTLPDATAGTLICGGRAVLVGQTIPAPSIDFLRFVPAGAEKGTAEFGFTPHAAGWETTTVHCKIDLKEHENFAPVCTDTAVETLAGVCRSVDLSAIVSDPDGDELTFEITRYPRRGILTLTGGNAIYTPKDGFDGEDSFSFVALDPYGAKSSECECTLTVAENDLDLVFADMESDPAHYAAAWLCAQNVMDYRKENGRYLFAPEGEVSKIDCLVMMCCLLGLADEIPAAADTDALDDASLPSGKKGFLQYALVNGIVRLDEGKFDPSSPVTAADAAFMAAALLELPGMAAKQVFSDMNAVPEWVKPAMLAADASGILPRTASLSPAEPLNRAAIASLLLRIRDYTLDNAPKM